MEWSTDQRCAIAESAIVHTAIKLGIGVSKPLTDGDRYDLIFALGGRLDRVQCKWATLQGDVVSVRCYSSAEIDAVAAYCSDLDRCYYFPIEWLDGRTTLQLRVHPTRDNQQSGINWADDFSLEHLQSASLGP